MSKGFPILLGGVAVLYSGGLLLIALLICIS